MDSFDWYRRKMNVSPTVRIGPFYGKIYPGTDIPRGEMHYRDTVETRRLHGGSIPDYSDPINIAYSSNGKFHAFICMYCRLFDTINEVEAFFDRFGVVEWKNIPQQNWMSPIKPCLQEIIVQHQSRP